MEFLAGVSAGHARKIFFHIVCSGSSHAAGPPASVHKPVAYAASDFSL